MTIPFIPPEIHGLIIDCADQSQYATLQLVCKAWKKLVSASFRKRYRKLCISDEESLKKYFGAAYTVPPASATQFLIHFALKNFTGYLRGKLDITDGGRNFKIDAEGLEPGDHPAVVETTKMMKHYENDPIFMPALEFEGPSQSRDYLIRFGWSWSDPASLARIAAGGLVGYAFDASGGPIRPKTTMKIRDFIKWWFLYASHSGDITYPRQPKRFVQHVGMWGSEDSTPEENEAFKFIEVRLVHIDE
ncbi:hypothetical protein ABW20_dc0109651 [Dactylellina cionopaga]|nr:hypothetical protein ABW20_dc0109651 [Dactylellina cionopaga]